MQCHTCGADVRPGQKFCMECGASLRGVSDSTGEVPAIHSEQPASDRVRDEVTQAMGAMADAPGERSTGDDQSQPPTGEPLAPPSPGDRAPHATPAQQPWAEDPEPARPAVVPAGANPDDHTDAQWRPGGADARSTTATTGAATRQDTRAWQHDPDATVQLPASTAWPDAPRDDRTVRMAAVAAPAAAGRTGRAQADTAELPAAGRGRTDQRSRSAYVGSVAAEYDAPAIDQRLRRGFRLRVLFVLGVLALGATATGVLTTVVEIGGSSPDLEGIWKVNDVGTNNALAAIVAAAVMVLGGFLWCFGFKWGAGLAGGAGAALAGWAALLIGLIEWRPIDIALLAGDASVTRDVGYWAVAAAGGLGAVALFVSLAGTGRDRQGGLDPWIAALGAASFLVAAGGPLIPLGTADITANYNAESLGFDPPTVFFVGRLVQVGLLALCGVVGFLLVRRYGLGLAVGSAVAVAWMVVTAATEQTANPIGPAYANPGAAPGDLIPHGVTIVGMGLAGFFALVAIVMALLDND